MNRRTTRSIILLMGSMVLIGLISVMQTAFLLTNITNMNQFLSDFTKFTLVLSALCHDVGHTGFNNAFEVAKGSYLAQMFNDISVINFLF
jgi:hypothetical protein